MICTLLRYLPINYSGRSHKGSSSLGYPWMGIQETKVMRAKVGMAGVGILGQVGLLSLVHNGVHVPQRKWRHRESICGSKTASYGQSFSRDVGRLYAGSS